jgi:hypothetical protein
MHDVCLKCKKKWIDHDDTEYGHCVKILTKWL